MSQKENLYLKITNCHTTKFFIEHLLAIEMKNVEILTNKPVYLGLSMLELSKILMYEFWYYYVKPKYGEKTNLWCMDSDSFIVCIKQTTFIKTLKC